MARTDKYKNVEKGGIDMLPFMNLMAILIPALLISTEYIKIATIGVSSPRIGPAAEAAVEQTDEKPPLNLHIVASGKGLYIASKNHVLPGQEEESAAAGPTVSKVNVKVYQGNKGSGLEEVLRVWTFEGKSYILGAKEVSSESLNQNIQDLKTAYGSLQVSEVLDYNYPELHKKLVEIKKAFKDAKGNDQVIISADPNIPFSTMIRIMDAARSNINDAGEKEWLFPQVILSAGVA